MVQITPVPRLRGVSHNPVLRIQQGWSYLKQDSWTCSSWWQLLERKMVDSEIWNTKCSWKWYNRETSFALFIACNQSAPSHSIHLVFTVPPLYAFWYDSCVVIKQPRFRHNMHSACRVQQNNYYAELKTSGQLSFSIFGVWIYTHVCICAYMRLYMRTP